MNNSGTPVGELSVSTRRGAPNFSDHPKELPQPLSSRKKRWKGPLLQVTKEWMALWPVDHAAPVVQVTKDMPTGRLGSVT